MTSSPVESRDNPCILIRRHGGPEVLAPGQTVVGPPGPGEAQVRHTAIGVNFADVYQREGEVHNDPLDLPFIPGLHAVGEVVALGSGVDDLKIGDRVTRVGGPGAYTTYRNSPAARLVKVPDALDDATVAATYARGLTCQYLVRQLHRLAPGDRILVHAAAGGLGQLLVRWAKHLGALVIGTVGTPEKAALVRALGADHAIDYTRQDFVQEVLDATGGEGVHVVYDAVGSTTFHRSLACLAPRGLAINFGTAAGPVPPLDIQDLHSKSLRVCRPTLRNWIATPQALREAAQELFSLQIDGVLSVPVTRELPLEEAAQAHALLQGRQVAGALVLRP